MPTVEKTSGGRLTVRDIGTFSPGDIVEVSDAEAQYLCDERGDFARVGKPADDDVRQEDGPPDETAEADVDQEGDNFEANGWLENDYQDRAEAVRAGGLDEFLDEIEEAETSETVIDAVDERRAELEE